MALTAGPDRPGFPDPRDFTHEGDQWKGVLWAHRESTRRMGILALGLGWLTVGIASLNQVNNIHHVSSLPSGILFLLAAVLTLAFAARPDLPRTYGASGGMACVALAARAFAIVWAARTQEDPDLIWIAALQVTLNVVMIVILWWFWQVEVKPWHIYHLTKRRISVIREVQRS